MVRSRRRVQRLVPLTGAAVVALVTASTPVPAVAAPAGTATPARQAAERLVSHQPATTHDVTLITGDRVHVTVTPAGAYRARVDVARRADGRQVFTQTLVDGEHLYVIPSDAAALVAAGALDRRLFDVRQLVEDGYTDAASGTLPVIAQYPGRAVPANATPPQRAQAAARLRARADALPASRAVRALESVNAAALAVTRHDAATLWSTVDPSSTATGLGAGLSRLWLDGRVQASLDVSVPMIGAPDAWAAGHDGTGVTVAVLDTGVDETHPDLAGTVVAGQSFVPGTTTVQDGNGHGTHVASTIAGSGAASGGRYQGVAPGARLAVGKVLDDAGSGSESWILAGMQWAAVTAHARIVSMSLGGGPSDGTDPLSQAVDDLSAATGTLFVIAAGNSGPSTSTVATPGAADAALTVAAVDKSDQLARFSSRGPRLVDYAMKPDIAAPGVAITAARAAGTRLGPVAPDNDRYVTISGTSMATPHVAGAAAILAQAHPDWTGEQIKAALTSTSRDDGYSVYEQGAGRVDVGAADRARVVADTVKVDFGRLRFPQTGPAVGRTVTYRNTGATGVTLDLAATAKDEQGGPAPAGMLTVTPSTLDVPAGGTAEATVTLDPALGPIGGYSGTVTATAEGVSLRTAVAAYKEPEGFQLNVRLGVPDSAVDAAAVAPVLVRRVDDGSGTWTFLPPTAVTSVHLPGGVYSVTALVVWKDSPGEFDNLAFLTNPQVDLHEDATIDLDAGRAERVVDETVDRATERYDSTMESWHTTADQRVTFGISTNQLGYGVAAWATPTAPVTVGTYLFQRSELQGTPLVTARVVDGPSLHPMYQSAYAEIPKLRGRLVLPVVDAGAGTAADFAKVDVRGRIALVGVGDVVTLTGAEALTNAKAAGAAAVFAYPDHGRVPMDHQLPVDTQYYPLPTVSIPAEEGGLLAARLAAGPVRVDVDSRPGIPDLYVLTYPSPGAVPASLHSTVRDRDLATRVQTIHAPRPAAVWETFAISKPEFHEVDQEQVTDAFLSLQDTDDPGVRTQHLGPPRAGAYWTRGFSTYALDLLDTARNKGGDLNAAEEHDGVVDRPGVRSEVWGEAPYVAGAPVLAPEVGAAYPATGACAACRYSGLLPDGDLMPVLPFVTDGWGHANGLTLFAGHPVLGSGDVGADEWHLYAGDTELPQLPDLEIPIYVLPHEQTTYRLTEHFVDWQQAGFGNRADTTWTFTSAAPTGREVPDGYHALIDCVGDCGVVPLVFLNYQFGLDTDNTLPAPGRHTFTVTAYHQQSEAAMPDMAGLRISASVDGGTHWTSLPVTALGGGRYSVTMVHPPIGGPTGTVSLRAEAWDTAGNRVVQVLTDAYGLRARG